MVVEKKAKVVEKFREGFTWEETAKAMGIGVATLYRWAAADPEFRQAIDEAKSNADDEVEAVTFANAINPDPVHNTLRMFWLNARKGFKTRADLTSGDKPVSYVERAKNPRDMAPIPAPQTVGPD